ncbi:MAG TPA: PGPGW domain-containing protein [Povalibacter sp.]|nr:PGPGW domain-containing protein [Povalibacter sp.]
MEFLRLTYRWARRCVIAVVGGTVVLIGIVMIVFPGPAVIVIPAGLAILGLEFAWAKHWLNKVRATGDQIFNAASSYWSRKKRRDRNPSSSGPPP